MTVHCTTMHGLARVLKSRLGRSSSGKYSTALWFGSETSGWRRYRHYIQVAVHPQARFTGVMRPSDARLRPIVALAARTTEGAAPRRQA
jgi:hypothetical protein